MRYYWYSSLYSSIDQLFYRFPSILCVLFAILLFSLQIALVIGVLTSSLWWVITIFLGLLRGGGLGDVVKGVGVGAAGGS